MKLTAITNEKQLYAAAVRIGELMKAMGAEAENEKKRLMKLLVEFENGEFDEVKGKLHQNNLLVNG
ncbi:hypothetical protein [Pontibacter cellulosilyticus]|uniref:Uncharacterized protein n=1 Tax=Pontibacter cellulosilyticus TaxID=1720253 RepID=A0A923N7A9_9BACT|nr:hypothetical protein [Pontibacter cellulosilyticus]MBC5994003.1 hypothetical protein [Pontibacter cellulosilyticus]